MSRDFLWTSFCKHCLITCIFLDNDLEYIKTVRITQIQIKKVICYLQMVLLVPLDSYIGARGSFASDVFVGPYPSL